MTQNIKKIIIGGLVGGSVFAGVMAVFDCMEGLSLRPIRFFFNLLFMSGFLGVLAYNSLKKKV